MKWKSNFMLSATGCLDVLTSNKRQIRCSLYVECLNDLVDVIDDNDVVDKQWLKFHINCLNLELDEMNNEIYGDT